MFICTEDAVSKARCPTHRLFEPLFFGYRKVPLWPLRLGLNNPSVAIDKSSLPTPFAMLPASRLSAFPSDSFFFHFAILSFLFCDSNLISANRHAKSTCGSLRG